MLDRLSHRVFSCHLFWRGLLVLMLKEILLGRGHAWLICWLLRVSSFDPLHVYTSSHVFRLVQLFCRSLNAVISINESTWIITGNVINKPAYTYKFQLKTNLYISIGNFFSCGSKDFSHVCTGIKRPASRIRLGGFVEKKLLIDMTSLLLKQQH